MGGNHFWIYHNQDLVTHTLSLNLSSLVWTIAFCLFRVKPLSWPSMKNYQLDLSKQIFVNFESIWNIFQWYLQYLKWFQELIWVEEVFQCVIIYAYIQICPLSQNSKPYMHFIIFTLQEVSKFLSSEHWNATWKLQLPRGNKNNQKFLQETHTPAYMNNCMIFLWKAYLSFLA